MCYLIANKFGTQGSYAVKMEHGLKLEALSDYLSAAKEKEKVQLVTISDMESYGEYAPYKEVPNELEFIQSVLAM